MENLLRGYRRFRAQGWPQRRARLEALAREGQRPHALVVACVDSRADPAMIFDAGPGELLVVRNVANLVPPYEPGGAAHGAAAALEFGVLSLNIPSVVVLGHELCGGIRFLLEGDAAATEFVGPWMQVARAARDRVLACTPAGDPASEDTRTACGQEAVRLSLNNLRGFPWIAARERDGRVRLHGAIFDIRTGALRVMDAHGEFLSAGT